MGGTFGVWHLLVWQVFFDSAVVRLKCLDSQKMGTW